MFLLFRNRRFAGCFSLALGFCLAVALTAGAARMADFADTCAAVRSDTVRLHIRAASDTVEDQTLKLAVRDAVVRQAARLCAAAENEAQAEAALRQNLLTLAWTARCVLGSRHAPQAVGVSMQREYFGTARYADATLPAGEYTALRITLGGGRGHNWWCCLYPSLCLAASGAHYARPAENALVTGKYEVRFAAVDLWEKYRRAAEA